MADTISLKVLIDKKKNKVIYAESDEDFVDVLFSFLTIPIGTILELDSDVKMGSMNKLYESVDEIDDQYFQTPSRKTMLLSPRNGAETHCNNLKVNVFLGTEDTTYFTCDSPKCIHTHKLLSYYEDATCKCGRQMKNEQDLSETESEVQAGVFVKRLTRFIITDDLQVMPVSTNASFSLYKEYGLSEESMLEERTWNISEPKEVFINLLVRSLVSRTPLTETFLKPNQSADLNSRSLYQEGSVGTSQTCTSWHLGGKKLTLNLKFSKTKRVVYYAEAGSDFVNLLFSFLTVPIGYLLENMSSGKTTSGSLNGCLDKLYKSAKDLDKRHFNSNHHREILVRPRLAFGFGYKHDLLEVEEASPPRFYYAYSPSPKFKEILTTSKSMITRSYSSGAAKLTVIDPKSHRKRRDHESDGGFLTGPAMFVVTNGLEVSPISSIFSLSILNKSKVPFSDVEEKIVKVGKEDALRLLLYSIFSETALTDAFMRWEPQQEDLVQLKEQK